MAISDKLNQTNGNVAPAAAPQAAPKAPTGGKGQKMADVLKTQGQALRAQMTEDQKAAEGSKRDKVAFVAAIGDPTHPQSRTENKQSKAGVLIVGYRLKALEDMTVPVCPLKPDCKDPLDCAGISSITVKAGDTFDVNLAEMTLLISQPEYAGKFSGEGQEVYISSSSTQDAAKVRPIFRLVEEGSIKTNTIMIADIVGKETDPKGKGQAVIKPEFADKFGAWIRKKSAKKSAGSATQKGGESAANLAAAFGNLYRQKFGSQN